MRAQPRPGIKPGVFRSMLRWPRGDGRRARGSVAGNEDDQARFRRVVLPHLSDAYALARWIVGNATDAEDVVQDACLRAFRGIGGFAGGNARAWVLTIVRHTAFTGLGKNRPAGVQEACLRAFRGIGGFAGGNARAWVLTIVRHTAFTWLGKNRPAALVVTDDLEAGERAALSRGGGGGTEA